MRRTQLQTLALIDRLPDGAIASDLAHEFGISIDAAEKRLDRLAGAGLIDDFQVRWFTGPGYSSGYITLARLTHDGWRVLREGRPE